MSVKTMDDLFVATLKDIYYAEKQILKALPGMVKKATGPELKKALETHRKETEGQVDRLDQVFKTRAERVVFVKGDPDLDYQTVARAIDIAKGVGIDKIGLMTPKIEAGE